MTSHHSAINASAQLFTLQPPIPTPHRPTGSGQTSVSSLYPARRYPARPHRCTLSRSTPHPIPTLCRPRPPRPSRPHAAESNRRERTNHAPPAGRATQAANHRGAGTRRSHRLTSRGNRAGSRRSAGRVPRVNGPASLPEAGPAQGRRQAGQLGRRLSACRVRAAGAHPASAPRVNSSMSLPAAGVAERAAPGKPGGAEKTPPCQPRRSPVAIWLTGTAGRHQASQLGRQHYMACTARNTALHSTSGP